MDDPAGLVHSEDPADAAHPAAPADPAQELVALARRLVTAAIDRALTLATAESCTGGLVGHLLTEIPGSSATYLGGAVSYSDALKRSVLGVPDDALRAHGAVSAQVAVAMADGARRAFQADVALAVTGIAGPDGGTDAKPVGLTYVAVADGAGHDVRRFLWTGDRSDNKRRSAEAVIRLALDRVEGVGAASPSGGPSPSV